MFHSTDPRGTEKVGSVSQQTDKDFWQAEEEFVEPIQRTDVSK